MTESMYGTGKTPRQKTMMTRNYADVGSGVREESVERETGNWEGDKKLDATKTATTAVRETDEKGALLAALISKEVRDCWKKKKRMRPRFVKEVARAVSSLTTMQGGGGRDEE